FLPSFLPLASALAQAAARAARGLRVVWPVAARARRPPRPPRAVEDGGAQLWPAGEAEEVRADALATDDEVRAAH
ncbi:Os12g0228300, partial [Oryza sativa Japonica Group]